MTCHMHMTCEMQYIWKFWFAVNIVNTNTVLFVTQILNSGICVFSRDESQPMEIPDEDAVKPEAWLDEEEPLIPDPDAEKPDDWDEDMDGEWEAPLVGRDSWRNLIITLVYEN